MAKENLVLSSGEPVPSSGDPVQPQLSSERRIRDAINTLVREFDMLHEAEQLSVAGGLTARLTNVAAGLRHAPTEGHAAHLGISRQSYYQLGDRLGGGGMAEVFRGWQIGAAGFERPVAIKRMLPKFAQTERFRAMFSREVQVLARLSHPNIVSALDLAYDDRGQPLLVLEYVDGIDLSTLIASGPVPLAVILFLGGELLNGLGYAHHLPSDGGDALGVVHRDLSPHNVLLSWDGAVKITDFGLAKTRIENDVSVSRNVVGKLAYMAPEHICREPLDGRADLFSLGAILWELLAGEPLAAHACPISSPSILRSVPRDLERVVMKLLRPDRNRRYRTAEVALDALAACDGAASLRGRSELVALLAQRFPAAAQRSTRRPPLPHLPIETAPILPLPLWKRWRLSKRRRRWLQLRRRARHRPRWGWCVLAVVVCLAAMLVLRVLVAKGRVSW